ncbi:MAG: hypothetical protein SGPRY_010001 [Prymnesium sp.]
MFARVQSASVHQENAVNMMQLDMLRLQTLQTQLGNVSMQATLVIGFAIAMLGGDNMVPLMDDEGSRCLYKSWIHMLCGLIFFLSVAGCVSYCFIVVGASSLSVRQLDVSSIIHPPLQVTVAAYLKQASQRSALLVSTRAAVANTGMHIKVVFRMFVRSIICFIISAVLLIWLFAGLPSRLPFDYDAAEAAWEGAGDASYVSQLDDGKYVITCLDPHSVKDQNLRNDYALALAGLTTALIVVMCAWGMHTFYRVRRTYEPRTLLSWYSKFERAEKRRSNEVMATAASLDRMREVATILRRRRTNEHKKKNPMEIPLHDAGTEEATYYAMPNAELSDDSVTGGPGSPKD